MTTELAMLVYATVLLIVLILIQAVVGIRANGFMPLLGNRDELPAPSGYAARTRRVVDNHREGLIVFAPLVLAAALAHVSDSRTVLGAQLFFYARVAHAALYLAGIPIARTLAYGVGVAGVLMILAALLGLGG